MVDMVSVLQISDLHRSVEDMVENEELLAALESDRDNRWPSDFPSQPDLIVVSGDLVRGAALDTADHHDVLTQQYSDAASFLSKMVESFLEGNRSRLVLVPGNHDVDWVCSRNAMEEVPQSEIAALSDRLPELSLTPGSDLRWDWKHQKLWRVRDPSVYASRLEPFLRFRDEFYDGVVPSPLSIDRDLFFMDYPPLDVSFTGLSSWYGNDCFCNVGAFDPQLLAKAQQVLAASTSQLHLAAWHHSCSGAPADTGFLDVTSAHRLIDYGYRIAFHGHQHKTDAIALPLKLPTREEMALISAGSLAAGHRELPTGVPRQYSLVELDTQQCKLRVHVREAISDLIFAESARTDLGGEPTIELTWTPSPRGRPLLSAWQRSLEDAYSAHGEGNDEQAAALLMSLDRHDGSSRQLALDVLTAIGQRRELIELLGAPESVDELIALVSCHLELDESTSARDLLDQFGERFSIAQDLREQLQARIELQEATR
jgi:hypothetical protein